MSVRSGKGPKPMVGSQVEENDSELVFLSELLAGYKYWKALAGSKRKANMNANQEESYADAYKVLLNRFTVMEVEDHE